MRTAFGSSERGNAGLATLGNVDTSRNVRTFHSKHQRYRATLRVVSSRTFVPLREARPSASHARKRSAGPPSGLAARAPSALPFSATSVPRQ